MQQLVDFFNQATTIEVGCKVRIKNLVANCEYAKVSVLPDSPVDITFTTTRKGKAPMVMSYTINREHLTAEQLARLTTASLPKEKK